jgi:hypothetical protein
MSIDKLAEILNVEQSVIAEALERFQANDQYAVVDDLILTEYVRLTSTTIKQEVFFVFNTH